MQQRTSSLVALVLGIILPFLFSCTKESIITSPDAGIFISADTVHFDTLFTTVRSITQSFKIFNTNDQKLKLSEVRLAGGTNTAFRININGKPGPAVTDIEIEANDSIYIFVNTQVPENQEALPFVVRDSIRVAWNGNERWVQLDTWGKNARFLRNRRISGNQTWTKDLPYVILGGLYIDSSATLNIEPGTRVYLHADAPIIVDGSLQANGVATEEDHIIFSSDRLDEPYSNFPGSWPGIYFRSNSSNNQITYTEIRNGYQGIIAEGPGKNGLPKLVLNQCILDNIYDAALLAINSSIEANNCLVSNSGKNIQIIYGGNYRFTHCTIAAYSTRYVLHKDPAVLISNAAKIDNTLVTAPLQASFLNSIVWGEGGSTIENEVAIQQEGNLPYQVSFSHSIWKMTTVPSIISTVNTTVADPLFEETGGENQRYIFKLKEGSPAIDKGLPTSLHTDLEGKPRNIGAPDAGAYERQ